MWMVFMPLVAGFTVAQTRGWGDGLLVFAAVVGLSVALKLAGPRLYGFDENHPVLAHLGVALILGLYAGVLIILASDAAVWACFALGVCFGALIASIAFLFGERMRR
jgi:hypothetical protein